MISPFETDQIKTQLIVRKAPPFEDVFSDDENEMMYYLSIHDRLRDFSEFFSV